MIKKIKQNKKLKLPFGFGVKSFLNSENHGFSDCSFLKRGENKMNKKAILLPEVLKIIIAVVCIVLLIYLAVKIYGILIVSSNLEKARASLDAIAGKINALTGDKQTLSYLITGPKSWYFIYFDDSGIMPEDCKGLACLCACSNIYGSSGAVSTPDISATVQECQTSGACKNIPRLILNNKCVKIGADSAKLGNIGGFTFENCFSLETVPLDITVEKVGENIKLMTSANAEAYSLLEQLLNYKMNQGARTLLELANMRVIETDASKLDTLQKTINQYVTSFFINQKEVKAYAFLILNNQEKNLVGEPKEMDTIYSSTYMSLLRDAKKKGAETYNLPNPNYAVKLEIIYE